MMNIVDKHLGIMKERIPSCLGKYTAAFARRMMCELSRYLELIFRRALKRIRRIGKENKHYEQYIYYDECSD